MLTIIWLFIKTAFSAVVSFFIKILPYILKFWREILIAAMVLLWQSEKSNHSATTQEFALFKQDLQVKSEKQELENALKADLAAKEIEDAQLTHATQLEKLKNDYDKRNKTHVDTIANLRNRLRTELETGGFRVPETESDTRGATEDWGKRYAELDRQYQTLIDACTITTSDYHLLRQWSDAACNQIGCEP